MIQIIKLIKSSIILLILFISVFAVSFPVYAWPGLNSNVNIVWGEQDVAKPVVPRDEIRTLNITVEFKVDYGGDFATGASVGYASQNVNAVIDLTISDHSPWCSADLGLETVLTPLTTEVTQSYSTLNLQLRDDAPAYGDGYVTIKAKVVPMGIIGGFEKEFTLDFSPEYLPRINVNLPEGNTKNIGPMDAAVLPIEVNNLGNARTTVFFKIEDVPKGWTVAVTDDITLDDSTSTFAYFTAKPPKEFGYHYDEKSIMVKLLPARAEDLTNTGEPIYVTFIIQSRGFSTPGFESAGFIGAVAVVMLIFILFRKRK